MGFRACPDKPQRRECGSTSHALRDDFGSPKSMLAKREFARCAKQPKTARIYLGKQGKVDA
jgi:hypothetical protein